MVKCKLTISQRNNCTLIYRGNQSCRITLRMCPPLHPTNTSPLGDQVWERGTTRGVVSWISSSDSALSPTSPAMAAFGSSTVYLVILVEARVGTSLASRSSSKFRDAFSAGNLIFLQCTYQLICMD